MNDYSKIIFKLIVLFLVTKPVEVKRLKEALIKARII
jgi:hypothetical protein